MFTRARLLRELQYQVVARDGTRCVFCGVETLVRNSPAWRAAVHPDPMERTVDHIVPRSKGGKDVLENLRLCCRGCNARRGVQTKGAWR